MDPSKEQIEAWHNDPQYWIWGMFYFNRQDNRVFVDKKPAWAGITLNFANPKSYLVILGSAAFFAFVVYMIESSSR